MAEDNYVFQRSSEAERLRRQGRLVENMTRPLLEKIGLSPGMSCLDVGCGPGEAMRLMGEMVGDTGTVVGVDIDGTAGRSAIDRLRGEIECNFQFIEQDLSGSNPPPQGPFRPGIRPSRVGSFARPDRDAAQNAGGHKTGRRHSCSGL
jgi:SAM-dependent methyltransferase